MNDPEIANEPLSPEAEAALRKARRAFLIAIGTMVLGFMAIAFALVYRITRDAPPPSVAERVVLPPAAEVAAAVVSDGTINVTYRLDGITHLALFDRATGKLVRTIVIATE
ncbi:MAG TPA: DUF6476 family protein [Devosia sp.]|jgi:hypothetical protein|nr:DUF6476 family protein [Devosia sp.]